jgi:predicted lipoprotein with Yx(FWY)xxD motif
MTIKFTARSAAVLLLGLAAACGRKSANYRDTTAAGSIAPDTNMPAAAPMAALPPGVILTVASKAGTGLFLADGSGRALYVLDATPKDTSEWKPVSGATAPTSTDTSIKAGMIGTTTGPSGMQATYGGKPLYYYADDKAAGDVKGENKKESGATGHLLHPDGTMVGGKPNAMNGKHKM